MDDQRTNQESGGGLGDKMNALSSAVIAVAGALLLAGSVGSNTDEANWVRLLGHVVLVLGLAVWGIFMRQANAGKNDRPLPESVRE